MRHLVAHVTWPGGWRNCRRGDRGTWLGRKGECPAHAQGVGTLGVDSGRIAGGVAGSLPGLSGSGEAGGSADTGCSLLTGGSVITGSLVTGGDGVSGSGVGVGSEAGAPLAHCSVTAAETSAARSVPSTRTMRRV